jgi:hypothetical protein
MWGPQYLTTRRALHGLLLGQIYFIGFIGINVSVRSEIGWQVEGGKFGKEI